MPLKTQSPLIELKHVSFSYNGKPVLEDVSVQIGKGEYIGVIGPNGGGKTTMLRLMLGLLKPTGGQVVVRTPREKIGYVPQRSAAVDYAFPATVREIVESGQVAHRNAKAIERAMKTTGITKFADRRIGALSGGERQRVMIARALAAEPSVLMLDEPTTAVDIENQEEFYKFLRQLHTELGITIVIVSHDVDVIAHEVERTLCLNRHIICHDVKGNHVEHYGH